MHMKTICAAVACLVSIVSVGGAGDGDGVRADPRPWDRQPYLGLSVRDTDEGLVVAWIYPGPLGGKSFTSESGVRRGDNLVSIDGVAVDADGFRAAIESKSPGDRVTLVFRRSPEAQMNASVPRGGPGGETLTLEVKLSDKDRWSGTIKRGLGGRRIAPPAAGGFERALLDRAREHGVADADGGLSALLENLRSEQEAHLDPNSLPAVVDVFRRPLSLDAVESSIAASVAGVRGMGSARGGDDLGRVASLLHGVLDLPADDGGYAQAMVAGDEMQRGWNAWGLALALVAQMRADWSIFGEHAEDHLRVIQMSADQAGPLIAAYLDQLVRGGYAWEDKVLEVGVDGLAPMAEEMIPVDVRPYVEGDILAITRDELGNIRVLGGEGENTYDMSAVAAVVDLGGNDRYVYHAVAGLNTESPTRRQSIIDLGGDDVYEAEAGAIGPASGVFGYSLIDDRGGDDVYLSAGQLGVGAGLFGVGVVIDRSGNDRYENTGGEAGFSIGAGFYGAGLVIDLAGSDVYLGEKLCQGVGGPRGFGAVIDMAGNDFYRANGSAFGSAYGTPAVFLGMSQGFGYGIRGYAAGGVGAVYDFAGHDQYEAGEFSQAGGYYWGLGIMHDAGGNDLYFGNRYGQAFAAHQAAGILVDDAGDDTYWSKTAASQAGTWDQSVGMLIDRAGNDAYRCDGLGLGAAAMQAVAVFLDLAGDDRYSANPGSVMGRSGSNTYHYRRDGVFSFSCFMDLGGGSDIYGGGTHTPARANNTAFPTGTRNDDDPGRSPLYGLFVDE